ncbi:GumC family protein [Marinifilum sp.]|uniref:GumC family protein n=1 Tax=Marinifilum sp. TaxID=2033137 RepID=UPI003BA8BFA3
MNIIFFIRLLQKHILVLAITPIIMVSLVFVLTKDQPKMYDSSTRIYTGIATGSSIVSLEESKLDLFGTRIAFDNFINLIRTKTTIEEVALRLFTKHMLLDDPTPDIILKKHYDELMEMVPADVKALIVKNDPEQTYLNLLTYKDANHTNFIYKLIHLDHRHYSSKRILAEIKVSRIQSSDMVKISYNSDDPGVCANTLELINEVFVRIYSDIKVNQSDAVVSYFLREIEKAEADLNVAEEELVEFNKAHNIINYYEQTRHIASEKEHFDLYYTEIKMKNTAEASVIDLLEGKMSANEKRRITSSQMLDVRKKLSDVNHKLWLKSNRSLLSYEKNEEDSVGILALQKEAEHIEGQLRELVDKQYKIINSKDGVTGHSILNRWLEKVIAFESSKAQLQVGDQIKKEFEELFEYYAPLGATMKRLERKINVAEQKYLSLLESLNKAKLKQQNIELNSNLKIVSPPFYPIEARASKRKFLLIIAFMIGFVIPTFIILVLEILDASIKTIPRAEDFIGKKVLAMFPNLAVKNKHLKLNVIKNKTLDVLNRKLLLMKPSVAGENKALQILVFSNQAGEGKTFVFTKIAQKLHDIGLKIQYISHNQMKKATDFESYSYEFTPNFHRVKGVQELGENVMGKENFDYTFVEIPGILNNSYPVHLVKESDYSMLVVRANRAWAKADKNSFEDFLSVAGDDDSVQVVLNGVQINEMENILGDLPKERSKFRRGIKNVLRLRFFTKTKFY